MLGVGLGRTYTDGEVIFNEGEQGNALYVIQFGQVKIVKRTPDEEITINTLGPGAIFGEMALFEKRARSAAAIAFGEARILTVDKKKFFATMSRDPTLAFKLMTSMSERVRRLSDELAPLKHSQAGLTHPTLNLDEACELMLQEMKQATAADYALLFLANEAAELVVSAVLGEGPPAHTPREALERIAQSVWREVRPQKANSSVLGGESALLHTPGCSILAAALKAQQQGIGVAVLTSGNGRSFTADDLNKLESLATCAAIALLSAKQAAALWDAAEKLMVHV